VSEGIEVCGQGFGHSLFQTAGGACLGHNPPASILTACLQAVSCFLASFAALRKDFRLSAVLGWIGPLANRFHCLCKASTGSLRVYVCSLSGWCLWAPASSSQALGGSMGSLVLV
jgi:hypothetical protein